MRKKLRVSVDGKQYDVIVEMDDEPAGQPQAAPQAAPMNPASVAPVAAPAPVASAPSAAAPAASGPGDVPSPLAGRVTARGTETANSIRAAVAAGRLRSRGRATSGPYVAPTLPLEIPPSTRTIDRDPARLGLSPISPTKPRLG